MEVAVRTVPASDVAGELGTRPLFPSAVRRGSVIDKDLVGLEFYRLVRLGILPDEHDQDGSSQHR
jgi:hypothetical protein